MKNKKSQDISQKLRPEFAKLWIKRDVHKNKKKYSRKLKHRKNDTENKRTE